MFSIRGATTVEYDNEDEVLINTGELLDRIIKANDICSECIISIIFTCTRDIQSAYPAKAARQIGITHAGLMCLQEMYVENSLEKCIRVLFLVNGDKEQSKVRHIYLNNAVQLRPDLLQEFNETH